MLEYELSPTIDYFSPDICIFSFDVLSQIEAEFLRYIDRICIHNLGGEKYLVRLLLND